MNQKMVLDLNDYEGIKCPACGNEYFEKLYMIKKVPSLLDSEKEEIVVIEIFHCLRCGTILNLKLNEKEGN